MFYTVGVKKACAGFSIFKKLQAGREQFYWKPETGTSVFPWFLRDFQGHSVYRTPLNGKIVNSNKIKWLQWDLGP